MTVTPDNTIFYRNHTPIISARWRPDMKWGFECLCGNDSRVAPEEAKVLPMLVRGGEHAIRKIAAGLRVGNEKKFKMVVA